MAVMMLVIAMTAVVGRIAVSRMTIRFIRNGGTGVSCGHVTQWFVICQLSGICVIRKAFSAIVIDDVFCVFLILTRIANIAG